MDRIAAYHAYSAAWNEKDDVDARKRLLDDVWADDGEFFDEETPEGLVGVDALSEYITATHEEMPGLTVTETSEPRLLGGRLRVSCKATQGDTEPYTGTDFVEFTNEGQLSRVTMFYDSTPD
jgi:hypothetical protein